MHLNVASMQVELLTIWHGSPRPCQQQYAAMSILSRPSVAGTWSSNCAMQRQQHSGGHRQRTAAARSIAECEHAQRAAGQQGYRGRAGGAGGSNAGGLAG